MKRFLRLVGADGLLAAAFLSIVPVASAQTVINSPPSAAPSTVNANTILNFHAGSAFALSSTSSGVINFYGGEVARASANSGGSINVYGGNILERLETFEGVANFYGGGFPDAIRVRSESSLTLHATEFYQNGVPVVGLVDVGDVVSIPHPNGSIITGVFSDGVPFVIGDSDELPASITLVKSVPYLAGTTTINVPSDVAPQGIHQGQTLILRNGGVLPINFVAGTNSTLQMEGGNIGRNFDAAGANIKILGGELETLDAFANSRVDIAGDAKWGEINLYSGSVATIDSTAQAAGRFRAFPGSTVNVSNIHLDDTFEATGAQINISGGFIGHYQRKSGVGGASHVRVTGGYVKDLAAYDNSKVDVLGGELGLLEIGNGTTAVVSGGQVDWFAVHDDSFGTVQSGVVGDTDCIRGALHIRGGALGDSHEWLAGTVELFGYDFQVNGLPIPGLDSIGSSRYIQYTPGSTITGTLSDGTPFNLAPNDNFQNVTIPIGVLRLNRTDAPSQPALIHVTGSDAPYGAAAGQTVIVDDGGSLRDHFLAGRASRVEIHGGSVGDNFEAERSDVVITAGVLGNRWDVFGGAEFVVSGGTLGNEFEVHPGGKLTLQNGSVGTAGLVRGGTVTMTGGSLGNGFDAWEGSTVSITEGTVGGDFDAQAGSLVQISGGTVGQRLEAYADSDVRISGGNVSAAEALTGSKMAVSGGNILESLVAEAGAKLTVSGGTFGDSFGVHSTSDFTLYGLNFEIDGVPVSGLNSLGDTVSINLAQNQLFTGTLADGNPIVFEGNGMRQAKLIRSADPSSGPAEIDVPSDAAPGGIRAGQHLTLENGGSLPVNFTAGRGSTVTIKGGSAGQNFEAYQATVRVEGGEIGPDAGIFPGTQLYMSAGRIGNNLDAHRDSVVNIAGGVATRIDALAGASIHQTGGQITSLSASNSSHTTVKGGSFGQLNLSGSESALSIHGASFKINGVAVSGLDNPGDAQQIDLPANSVLTAILSDGTPMLLSPGQNSALFNAQLPSGALTLVRSDEPARPGPVLQVVDDADAPFALGSGQTLQLLPGGVLPRFFIAGPESHLQIKGGTVGTNFKAWGGKVELLAGSIGSGFAGLDGLDLEITGGSITAGMTLLSGVKMDLSGGLVTAPLGIDAGVEINIYGKSFRLANSPIAGLVSPGDSAVITARGSQLLTGTLADGSPLSWRLATGFTGRGITGFSDQAIVRVHLVPEPTSVAMIAYLLGGVLLSRRRRRTIQ